MSFETCKRTDREIYRQTFGNTLHPSKRQSSKWQMKTEEEYQGKVHLENGKKIFHTSSLVRAYLTY